MNGTSGMRPKMAHASFQPRAMSGRVARSSHIKTTARGCRKQTRSSKSFFIALNLPRPMCAWPTCPRSLTSAHGSPLCQEGAVPAFVSVLRSSPPSGKVRLTVAAGRRWLGAAGRPGERIGLPG